MNGVTPLELTLQKCYDHLEGDEDLDHYFRCSIIAVQLVESNAKVDESIVHRAINFPKVLEKILEQNPHYYKPDQEDGSSFLTRAINLGLHDSFCQMGFIERMLQNNADTIIMELIKNDGNFLKKFKNNSKDTPLHSAVKVGSETITKELMRSGLVIVCVDVMHNYL